MSPVTETRQDACDLHPAAAPPESSSSVPAANVRHLVPPSVTPVQAACSAQHGFLQAFQSLLYVITVALFIITFIAQPFRIPSESMLPTLLVGDFLLVDKQVGPEPSLAPFAPANQIRRGDLIVFHFPIDPTLHLVKRVIGIPGDHLRLHNGRLILNGNPVAEPYAIFRPSPPNSFRDEFPQFSTTDPDIDSRWWIQLRSLVSNGELVVPPGHFFVLGDNRNDSEDSRYWGLVPQSAIVGKPFVVYFSLNSPAAMPGQTSAAALAGHNSADLAPPHTAVRWDRALHVIR